MRLLPCALFSLTALLSAQDQPQPQVTPITPMELADFLESEAFRGRCLTDSLMPTTQMRAAGQQSDCTATSTTILPEYDPDEFFEIQVVFHVLMDTNGNGLVPLSRIDDQIAVLNEDFLAKSGSNGANGTNGRIHFNLATFDPAGNPTNGVTYSTDDSWYADSGAYYNSLAWDPNRYLNVYTNTASGALGYFPGLPQNGILGASFDRVVVHWATVGSPAPFGVPFHLGRTLTHELGHYFGLYHSFNGGCANGNCYSGGDRICDTNNESSPTSGCPTNRTSCGGLAAPVENYMDYSDDVCMEQFTPEQINRMRCTIGNWRSALARERATVVSRNGTGVNPVYTTQRRRAIVGLSWRVTVDIQTPSAVASFFFVGLGGPVQSVFIASGELLVLPPLLRQTGTGDHIILLPTDISLVGQTFSGQAATWSPQSFQLTNALDMTIGY